MHFFLDNKNSYGEPFEKSGGFLALWTPLVVSAIMTAMATLNQLMRRSAKLRRELGESRPLTKVNAWAILPKPGAHAHVFHRRQRELAKVDYAIVRLLKQRVLHGQTATTNSPADGTDLHPPG